MWLVFDKLIQTKLWRPFWGCNSTTEVHNAHKTIIKVTDVVHIIVKENR